MKSAKKTAYYALCTLETLFIVFVAMLAMLNAVMFFQYKVLDYPVPKVFGYSFINVLSGSMEPTVSAGDLVICKEQDAYAINDPVLFEDQGFLVLHRIAGVDETGAFITKGDANNVNDKVAIQPENVYGRMTTVLPGWGNTLAYLSSRMGAFWTVFAALFIYLALDMGKDLLKETEKEEEAEEACETTANGSNTDDLQEKSFEIVFNEIQQEKRMKEKRDK